LTTRPVPSPSIFTAADGKSRWTARPLLGRAIEKIVTCSAEAADLAHGKPHGFRRFVGTQLARVDMHLAQKALGHQSILTTERHYVLDKLEAGWTDHLSSPPATIACPPQWQQQAVAEGSATGREGTMSEPESPPPRAKQDQREKAVHL
jgi:hypothetical protein